MNTRYIVTAVDISETSDHKARVLLVALSEAYAKKYVKDDMKAFIDDSNGMELDVDFDKMSISSTDGNYGCEWNIEKVDVGNPAKVATV